MAQGNGDLHGDGDWEVEEVDADDIEWLIDEDGTEYFLEDGIRYEVADDGFAYPVLDDERLDASTATAAQVAAADDPADDDPADERDGWDDWDVVDDPEPVEEFAALDDDAVVDSPPPEDAHDEVEEPLYEYVDEDGNVLGYGDEDTMYLDADMQPLDGEAGEADTSADLAESSLDDDWLDDDLVAEQPEDRARPDSHVAAHEEWDDWDELADDAEDSPFSPSSQSRRTPATGVAVSEPPPEAPADEVATAEKAVGEVLLRLEDVRSGYGSLPVLHGVSTEIRRGETAVLLGLNGAGKTTTALNICGALRTWSGRIVFDGEDITNFSVKQAVKAGIIMCPEGRRVFPELSVARNLQIGAWMQRADKDWIEEQTERVFTYFPRLRQRTAQLAGSLSGGEQQMLAMSRALMARPRLLIVDEASMGLAPVIVKDVFDIVAEINRDGVTVLLIEQNVGALEVADLGLVMEQGRMVKELRGERLRDRREVTEVLMGDGGH